MLKIINCLGEICNKPTEGKGLKVLTPNQILSRLPIYLAQLKAGNNSEKLVIYQMVPTQFVIFKIILNLLLKNMKL